MDCLGLEAHRVAASSQLSSSVNHTFNLLTPLLLKCLQLVQVNWEVSSVVLVPQVHNLSLLL